MFDSPAITLASYPSGCLMRLIRVGLATVGEAAKERGKGLKNRRGAATAVSWLMADALLFFAKNANFKPWLDRKLAEAEKENAWLDERKAKDKAEFVARMKAGKAAKASKALMEVTQ